MNKFVCMPVDYTGVGYSDGVKQCQYICYPEGHANMEKTIVAPAIDLTDGDVCYGVEFHNKWTPSGKFSNIPYDKKSFTVDMNVFFDWGTIGKIRDVIRKEFKQ